LNDSEIFNDMKRRAVSLRQLSLLFQENKRIQFLKYCIQF